MKKFQNIFVALLIAVSFFGCEKDDICASTTPTTPRLIIEFYDFSNSSVLKSVTNLKAQAVGKPQAIIFDETAGDPARFRFTGTKISLPLDIAQETISYTLINNSDSTNPLVYNEDVVTFNYARREIYVSRACGYKTNFVLDNITEAGSPDEQWIRDITIETPNVDNEADVHVKIFF